MTKQWKSTGPEQELLERMFDEGGIEDWETPAGVQARDPLFKPFSERVFSNHFRATKLKLGYGGNATIRRIDLHSNVPELGLVAQNVQCRPTSSNSTEEHVHPLTSKKGPCWTWVYTDHEKKKDFVCVAIPALIGKNSKFTISEDGMMLTINYDWPEVMMKANELFSKSNASNGRKLSMSHPKVHSFISHLHECGVTEKSTLHAELTVNFPKKVQRESNSWSMEKVVISDIKMILLEFSAFQKALIINDCDTSLDF